MYLDSENDEKITPKKEFSLDRLMLDSNLIINISQNVIATTEDKLELCLLKYLKTIQKKRQWLISLGIFLPSVTTVITCEFKSFIIKASIWFAFFLLISILSFCWFLYSLRFVFKSHTINDIIDEIKNNSKDTENEVIRKEDNNTLLQKLRNCFKS